MALVMTDMTSGPAVPLPLTNVYPQRYRGPPTTRPSRASTTRDTWSHAHDGRYSPAGFSSEQRIPMQSWSSV